MSYGSSGVISLGCVEKGLGENTYEQNSMESLNWIIVSQATLVLWLRMENLNMENIVRKGHSQWKQVVYFARHIPQFKMLIIPFLSDVWIARN